MTAPARRPLPRRPPLACCPAGATSAPGACPWHDSWRHVAFTQPPPLDHDDQEEQ